jgi:hypothetical protein
VFLPKNDADVRAAVGRRHLLDHPAFGPAAFAVIALWLAAVLLLRLFLLRRHIVVADLYLWANALANTDWRGKFLYVAEYADARGAYSLLQDHFEPSSILLALFSFCSDIPLALTLFQSLAPVSLVLCLARTSRQLSGRAAPGLVAAVSALFNPTFIDALTDGVYGFHHDAQFLVYTPCFLMFFLLRRPGPMAVFLGLFLGVKQDAAFYALALGMAAALLGRPGEGYRRQGALVAAVSLVYCLLAVFVLPNWIHSDNKYAEEALTTLDPGSWNFVTSTVRNFFRLKWHNILLANVPAFLSPELLLPVLPDMALFSILPRQSNLYYDYNMVIFLSFGGLMTLIRPMMGWRRWLPVLALAQAVFFVPAGLREIVHLSHKIGDTAPLRAELPADALDAAWNATDLTCTVGVSHYLNGRFYRLPYWIYDIHLDDARTIVTIDPAWMTAYGRSNDLVLDYVQKHAAELEPLGHFGPLILWRNPRAACRLWWL